MAFKHLKKYMKEYLSTGEHSDMKIIDRGKNVHHVHKLVLCSQSKYFRSALKESRFKEGLTNTLHFEEDHPGVVKAMLEYLYLEEYADTGYGNFVQERLLFNIDVYSIGDKCMVADTGLCEAASKKIRVMSESSDWETMMKEFPNALLAAYDKTPSSDLLLRPLMVNIADEKLHELLEDKTFRDAMDTLGEFGRELAEKQKQTNRMLEGIVDQYQTYRLQCPACQQKVRMFLPTKGRDGWGIDRAACIYCGTRNLISVWHNAIVET